MKKTLSRWLAAVLICAACVSTLTGCGETVSFRENLEKYESTLPYRDGFTVLQLTDIHWNSGTPIAASKRYLKKVIDEAVSHAGKIDMIEITGDTFMFANAAAVSSFIDFMEDVGIPYAVTWGNHDREGNYHANYPSKSFLAAEHCLYKEVDNDDVAGRANYVVNLVDGTGAVVWQLVNLDSGASYREGATDLKTTYDYIREDQFDFLSAIHEKAGASVPAICYYHIPQADCDADYEKILAGDDGYYSRFYKLEGFAASKFAPFTAECFKENNVRAVFMGHAHSVDLTYTTPDGITYGFGVKSGTELYYATVEAGDEQGGFTSPDTFDLIGASLVTLCDKDGNFTLEHLYLNERDGNDFVLWVNYRD